MLVRDDRVSSSSTLAADEEEEEEDETVVVVDNCRASILWRVQLGNIVGRHILR